MSTIPGVPVGAKIVCAVPKTRRVLVVSELPIDQHGCVQIPGPGTWDADVLVAAAPALFRIEERPA